MKTKNRHFFHLQILCIIVIFTTLPGFRCLEENKTYEEAGAKTTTSLAAVSASAQQTQSPPDTASRGAFSETTGQRRYGEFTEGQMIGAGQLPFSSAEVTAGDRVTISGFVDQRSVAHVLALYPNGGGQIYRVQNDTFTCVSKALECLALVFLDHEDRSLGYLDLGDDLTVLPLLQLRVSHLNLGAIALDKTGKATPAYNPIGLDREIALTPEEKRAIGNSGRLFLPLLASGDLDSNEALDVLEGKAYRLTLDYHLRAGTFKGQETEIQARLIQPEQRPEIVKLQFAVHAGGRASQNLGDPQRMSVNVFFRHQGIEEQRAIPFLADHPAVRSQTLLFKNLEHRQLPPWVASQSVLERRETIFGDRVPIDGLREDREGFTQGRLTLNDGATREIARFELEKTALIQLVQQTLTLQPVFYLRGGMLQRIGWKTGSWATLSQEPEKKVSLSRVVKRLSCTLHGAFGNPSVVSFSQEQLQDRVEGFTLSYGIPWVSCKQVDFIAEDFFGNTITWCFFREE